MSNYTVTVYHLEKSDFDFGLQNYSIFSEEYRETLNKAILDYYRFREIGFQNPAVWRDRLNTKLDRIMRDKYNKLYEARLTEFNPLYNIDITETFVQKSDGSTSGTSNNNYNDDSLGVSSAFPSEEMTENDLKSNLYVDNAQKNTSTGSGNAQNQTQSNQNDEYTRKTVGSSAGLPFSKALMQLHQYADMYDLDMQVIQDLSDLFMNVW